MKSMAEAVSLFELELKARARERKRELFFSPQSQLMESEDLDLGSRLGDSWSRRILIKNSLLKGKILYLESILHRNGRVQREIEMGEQG